MLAVGRDGRVADAVTGRPLAALPGRVADPAAVVSPDDRLLAVGDQGRDAPVHIVDLTTGRTVATLAPHRPPMALRLLFSPDGQRLAVSGGDGTVRLWDIATRTAQDLAGTLGDVAGAMAFSPDGHALVTAEDTDVRLWDTDTGHLVASYAGHTDPVTSVAFGPGGRTFASGDDGGITRVWAAAADPPWQVLEWPGPQIRGLAFGPGGRRIATVAADGGDSVAGGDENARDDGTRRVAGAGPPRPPCGPTAASHCKAPCGRLLAGCPPPATPNRRSLLRQREERSCGWLTPRRHVTATSRRIAEAAPSRVRAPSPPPMSGGGRRRR
ncbi:WD40 repeat domain-containing protein, partial [Streptomyces sp. ST1020]|uniref:WD40 repeat domain-containing protein n=1 Tax=Streptomyces sp. ST1020 TaxID=1848901 RepID=UPI0034C6CDCB